MKIKYNRISTEHQNYNRASLDDDKYDLILHERISGKVPFNERPKGMKVISLINENKITDIIIEDVSRLGRNTSDNIQILNFFEEKEINVKIKNLGIESRPSGIKNPIWNIITTLLSSMHELELENIKERTSAGRRAYIQNGGVLGRPVGSNENERNFLNKEKPKKIIKLLKKERTIREISAITKTSHKTIVKTKRIATKYGLL